MSSVLLVGDAPPRITDGLRERGHDVRAAPTPTPGATTLRGVDLLVVTVATAQPREADLDWLHSATDAGVRSALLVEHVTRAVLDQAYLATTAKPLVELSSLGEDGWAATLDQLCARLAPQRPSGDAVEIGRYFPRSLPAAGAADYYRQRTVSFASLTMQGFLDDLREALRQLSLVPDASTPPPWDPRDEQPISRMQAAGSSTWTLGKSSLPNLSDLFAAHGDGRARALLRTGAQERRADAEAGVRPHLLVLGESGSGKTLVADIVHGHLAGLVHGRRLPFVTINCGGLGSENLDHELFGAAPDHWTGVSQPVVGSLAQAAYGLAFLDEIGDLQLSAQQRLLVYLGDGLVRPSGIQPFHGHTRVIAATNRDLDVLIRRGQFRHDLRARFRLTITIPPLRQRGTAELDRLIDFVALNPSANPGLEVTHIAASAMERLRHHEYREGNFRELETVVHHAIAQARRRDSVVVEERDLTFTAPAFVSDAEQRLVDLAPSAGHGPAVEVASAADLDRLAAASGAAVLRAHTGELLVDLGHGRRYRWTPSDA